MSAPEYSSDVGVGMDSDRKSEDNSKSLALTQTHGSVHVGNVVNSDPDQLKRHLGNRQIQLIAIGGSMGTATFVSISTGLAAGGPGSLSSPILSMPPVTGAFIRMAGKGADESFGFLAGWNFYIYEAILI
ncbi:hypothetical protein LA080_014760 [Diaporthe eres]|nr:hypothetical protein LA080_014760 [Diaporthe eres]